MLQWRSVEPSSRRGRPYSPMTLNAVRTWRLSLVQTGEYSAGTRWRQSWSHLGSWERFQHKPMLEFEWIFSTFTMSWVVVFVVVWPKKWSTLGMGRMKALHQKDGGERHCRGRRLGWAVTRNTAEQLGRGSHGSVRVRVFDQGRLRMCDARRHRRIRFDFPHQHVFRLVENGGRRPHDPVCEVVPRNTSVNLWEDDVGDIQEAESKLIRYFSSVWGSTVC